MGASSSFVIHTDLDIYFSYPEKTEYIERMMNTLQNMNFTVIDSSIIIKTKQENDISSFEISKNVDMFIEKTKYIFVCISKDTIKSVTQTIEMNEIMDKYPTIQKKIIYFMMDPEYTPITNKELKSIINQNVWYPIYDEDSLFYTTNKLLTLLINNAE